MSEALEPAAAGTRSLSTARAVLRVLDFLARHPEGVRADEVARFVGKSVSTAYYLLASLCAEGFAIHDSHAGLYRAVPATRPAEPPAEPLGPLEAAVERLLRQTHKRSYVGFAAADGIEIAIVRGRQGMPRVPGLGTTITDQAHALAIGKVALAHGGRSRVENYLRRGLRKFTARTITEPDHLLAELEEVRRRGIAVDREEFGPDFCCVAAPILGARQRLGAVLALSATTHAFDIEQFDLIGAVREVASTVAERDSKQLQKSPFS